MQAVKPDRAALLYSVLIYSVLIYPLPGLLAYRLFELGFLAHPGLGLADQGKLLRVP